MERERADEGTMARASERGRGGWHLAEWACELVGTAILVLGGLSAVALDFSRGSPVADLVPSTSVRLLLTGLLFAGTGSLVAVSPLGRRSGGHLNPAVTLAFWATKRGVHLHDLAGYIAAQLTGGILGAGLFRLLWGEAARQVDFGVTGPGPQTGAVGATLVEAAMTGALVLTIFAFVSSPRTARWTPLAVWLLVATLVWRFAPITGTSLNPARSLGPALVAGAYRDLWVYFLGPIAGALLVAWSWRLVPARVLTAKLFHDPRYPSVMGCDLAAMPG